MTQARPSLADHTDRAGDRAELTRMVEAIGAANNAKDSRQALEHYASDAITVSALGGLVRGYDDLFELTRDAFGGFLRTMFAEYHVDDIVFLDADTAVVYSRANPTNELGERTPAAPGALFMYVMRRRDDRWWVATRSATMVPSPE